MAANRVKVTLKENGEPSGLAMMMLQYFEQNIRDFEYKSDQARKITGKLALEAAEGDVGVTLHFKGDEIEVSEGCATDAALFIRGGVFDLTEMATGGPNAMGKVIRGDLKVRSGLRHPLFAMRVTRFMSMPAELQGGDGSSVGSLKWKLLAGAGAAAIFGLAAFLVFR